MKKIAKLLGITLFICMTFLISACTNENVEGTLEDLIAKVYSNLPEEETPMMLENIEVTDENIEYYLGTSDIEYEEAIASESMTGSIAHSVVLLRAKDGANVEEIKTKIKENVDPRKWICTGVAEEEVIVTSKGDLVILIMVSDGREKLEEGFNNL